MQTGDFCPKQFQPFFKRFWCPIWQFGGIVVQQVNFIKRNITIICMTLIDQRHLKCAKSFFLKKICVLTSVKCKETAIDFKKAIITKKKYEIKRCRVLHSFILIESFWIIKSCTIETFLSIYIILGRQHIVFLMWYISYEIYKYKIRHITYQIFKAQNYGLFVDSQFILDKIYVE